MIDTIEFRVHDLKKHKQFLNTLVKDDINGKKGYLRFIRHKDLLPEYNKRIERRMSFNDTGNDMAAWNSNKFFVPSSHYFIVYSINFEKDFIHFNFSLPKFLYGTNILQFVIYPLNPLYSRRNSNKVEWQIEQIGYRFHKAMKYFFEYNFNTIIHLDYSDIEIRRIDFCYNQVFENKEQAIKALKQKMRFKFPRLKNQNNSMQQYDTSISYKSSTGKYFKIYHKGTEYESNDMKRHISMVEGLLQYGKVGFKDKLRSNKVEVYTSFGKKELPVNPVFNVQLLKELADRTLRYEITYRPRDISQYFIHQLFRKNDKDFQQKRKMFLWLKKENEKTGKLSSDQKKLLNQLSKIYNKTFSFRLKANPMHDILTMKRVKQYNIIPTEITLTSEIVKMLAIKFWQYVTHYQLKFLPSRSQFLNKIHAHNKQVDAERKEAKKALIFGRKTTMVKYQVPRMVMLFDLLKKHTWSEIQQMQLMSKTSFYKARKDFENLGIDRNSIKPIKLNVSLDFSTYYDFLLTVENKVITKYISPFSLSI